METIHPSATSKLVLFHQQYTYNTEQCSCSQEVQSSCSQEVQSRVHVHRVQSSVHIRDQYGVVFMFTKSMEHTISVHEQKQCVVQFMFTNRTAQICLQEAVQSSIHVHSFSAGQRQNYQRFQTTIATFLCFKNAFILAFPQMCVHQFKDKIWYGRSLDLIG